MSKDKKYLSSYVPEAKPKETPARGKVKSDTDLDEIKKELRELQEWIAKNNRDQLDAMQNIGAKNLSSSYRRSLNGEFVKTNALIQTWADSQGAGFRAIADWQSEQEIILQNINGELENFVEEKDIHANIESYINGPEGVAAITQSLYGTFALKDELGNYVKTTDIDASVSRYINGKEGIAQITDNLSGTFLDINALDGYAKTTEVSASISREINQFGASLTLSVTNGNESSTISLMNGNTTLSSKTITLSGLVSFTDLSTAGSTSINGANIITGTISADMINVNDLKVKQVWFNADSLADTVVLTSDTIMGERLDVRLGVQDNTNNKNFVSLYGSAIYCYLNDGNEEDVIEISMLERYIRPQLDDEWTLGTEHLYWYAVYSRNYYFRDTGCYLRVSGGNLRFENADGDYVDLTDF